MPTTILAVTIPPLGETNLLAAGAFAELDLEDLLDFADVLPRSDFLVMAISVFLKGEIELKNNALL